MSGRGGLILASFSVLLLLVLVSCSGRDTSSPAVADTPTAQATPTPASAQATPSLASSPTRTDEQILDDWSSYMGYQWMTDVTKSTIPLQEINFLGMPRDTIPPIYNPVFEGAQEAKLWLGKFEPVLALELNGDARAYPLRVFASHEIVNDEVGGAPIAVTF